ncbi:MAG: hypothetical protein A2W35_10795 [Chloroflexi bacterium RBG_16_57_11]|nr:MAG: hypothetical protein A2W35_10795 [Chloroflexi bacterium RBG_16_57_11]
MKKLFSLVVVLILLVSACNFSPQPTSAPTLPPATVSQPEPVATTTEVPATPINPGPTEATVAEASPVPVAYGPSGFPADVSPLTGLKVSDPALLERRPVAVKVQMFPRGQRPPWGVSQADIVFDYYQNFGLTRFHAIFYSKNAEIVGPIRSARLLDIDLINMHKSVFAFGSAEQRTYTRLFNKDFAPRLVVEGNTNCPPMCREDPNGYNYLVTDTAELSAYVSSQGVDNTRQNLDGMRFNPATPVSGQPGQQLTVRYSISSYNNWSFDSASGRYLRFQDVQEAPDQASEAFEPLLDRANGQQIAAENVVILVAPHKYAFNSKPGPNEVIEILLSGSGPAYAFRDGQVFNLLWNRPAEDSVISLTYPDGTPFASKPGTTWYQVIGRSSQITQPDGQTWRFQHMIP